MKQPAQIFQRVRHALQKMSFAFVEAAKTIRTQGLHDANVNVSVVVLSELRPVDLDEPSQLFDIEVEQLLSQLWRQIGLGIEQKRRNVILQCAFSAALIIQKKWFAV